MTISMPAAPGFSACRFGLETNTQTWTSPLTKATQRAILGGARWTATYTLPPMSRGQMADWQAFLMLLEGGANTFSGYDPDAVTPRGKGTGSPLTNGTHAGSVISIDGCTPNVTNWLMAGDYFAVNGELKMLTQNANTDGAGQAGLYFKPALRATTPDNAPVTVVKAGCTMALVDDGQSVWQTGNRLGFYEGLTFSAYEVFS